MKKFIFMLILFISVLGVSCFSLTEAESATFEDMNALPTAPENMLTGNYSKYTTYDNTSISHHYYFNGNKLRHSYTKRMYGIKISSYRHEYQWEKVGNTYQRRRKYTSDNFGDWGAFDLRKKDNNTMVLLNHSSQSWNTLER